MKKRKNKYSVTYQFDNGFTGIHYNCNKYCLIYDEEGKALDFYEKEEIKTFNKIPKGEVYEYFENQKINNIKILIENIKNLTEEEYKKIDVSLLRMALQKLK
jgi:hypothetical protein